MKLQIIDGGREMEGAGLCLRLMEIVFDEKRQEMGVLFERPKPKVEIFGENQLSQRRNIT